MMNDFLHEFITIIGIILVIVAVIVACVIIGENHDDRLWNNGYCTACGSEMEYEQAVGHYYSTSYMYVCKKCGRRIEIGEIR